MISLSSSHEKDISLGKKAGIGVLVELSDDEDDVEDRQNATKETRNSAISIAISSYESVQKSNAVAESTNVVKGLDKSSVIQLLDYSSSSEDSVKDEPGQSPLEPGQVMEEEPFLTHPEVENDNPRENDSSTESGVLRSESVLQSLLKNKLTPRSYADDIPSLPLKTASDTAPEASEKNLSPPSPIRVTPTSVTDECPGLSFSSMLGIPPAQTAPPPANEDAGGQLSIKKQEDVVDQAPVSLSTFSMMTNYAAAPPSTASPTISGSAARSVSADSYRSTSPIRRGGARGGSGGYNGSHKGYNKHNIIRQSAFEAAQEHAKKMAAAAAAAASSTHSTSPQRGHHHHGDHYMDTDDRYSRKRDRSPHREDRSPGRSPFSSLKEQYSLQPYKRSNRASPDRGGSYKQHQSRSLSPDLRHHRGYNDDYEDDFDYRGRSSGGRGREGAAERRGAGGVGGMAPARNTASDDYERSLLEYESDNDNYKTNRFKTKNSKNITLV